MLDVSQQELALAAGVSRSHIAGVESGRVNPSIDLVWRIAERLGIEIDIIHRSPILLGRRTSRDLVHARCSGYVEGRLLGAGWVMRREVEVMANRAHGWIDLLAFEPISRTLVIVEIKTRLDDLGAVERQLGWYERHAMDVAHSLGWHPRRFLTWLILLASDEVEGALVDHRQLLRRTFPERAAVMRAVVIDGRAEARTRRLALVDPASRRRDWLLRSRSDGRRSPAPYRDYGDAARRFAA
jgi:transcriptional regulator with XRE-family HTH domain